MFDKLKDWVSVLVTCQRIISGLSDTDHSNSDSKLLDLVRSALRHTRLTGAHAILSNFDIAAGHILYLCERKYGEGEFPDLPPDVNLGTVLK